MQPTTLHSYEEKAILKEAQTSGVPNWEIICIVGGLLSFLLIVLSASSRFVWWQDEVMFVDPAVNLYYGKGFTSTAWQFQNKDKFWASNLPLYSSLLYNWIKMFGFTAVGVRSLNYVLMVISGLMLWLSAIRLDLVKSSRNRIALIALFLLSEGLSFNYCTARYDCLGIALFLAGLLVYSLESKSMRCLLLAGIAIFIPMTGLHLVAYIVLLCGLLLVYLRKSFVREAGAIAIGLVIGGIVLVILYASQGVLLDFIKATLASGDSITGKIGQALVQHDYKHVAKYAGILNVFFQDRSFIPLLALAIAIGVDRLKKGTFQFRSTLSFGLAVAFGIPVGVFILGKYPIYYGWMAFIPLAICVLSNLDSFKFNQKKWTHLLVLSVLTLTCLVGLPRKLAQAVSEWNARDYAPIEALVERNVTKNDWAYSEFIAYYAAKKRAAVVILPTYAQSAIFPAIPEREKVSVAIVQSEHFEEVAKKLGGNWYDSGDGISSKLAPYNLKVFKRKVKG